MTGGQPTCRFPPLCHIVWHQLPIGRQLDRAYRTSRTWHAGPPGLTLLRRTVWTPTTTGMPKARRSITWHGGQAGCDKLCQNTHERTLAGHQLPCIMPMIINLMLDDWLTASIIRCHAVPNLVPKLLNSFWLPVTYGPLFASGMHY